MTRCANPRHRHPFKTSVFHVSFTSLYLLDSHWLKTPGVPGIPNFDLWTISTRSYKLLLPLHFRSSRCWLALLKTTIAYGDEARKHIFQLQLNALVWIRPGWISKVLNSILRYSWFCCVFQLYLQTYNFRFSICKDPTLWLYRLYPCSFAPKHGFDNTVFPRPA